jgi:xanthine dehydrogenase accessory factor
MTAPRVFAIVPAAGLSRRMGRPKLLLEVDGRPLLLALLEPLAAASIAGLVLVTRHDIATRVALERLPRLIVAHNEDDESEMVDSVRLGLRTWLERQPPAPHDGFLVCPADQPGITPADFEACVAAFRAAPEQLVIATYGGRAGHPLIFPAALAAFVQSPACDHGLHALPQKYADRVKLVECQSAAVVRDVDEPGDVPPAANPPSAIQPPLPNPQSPIPELAVLETLLADVDTGRPAAFCAVVNTTGSTPQVPGAVMLVRSDYSASGTLGGGCVEAEVQRRAFQLLQAGKSGLLDFQLDHDYGWDDGLLCGGSMQIAVVSISDSAALQPFRAALDLARNRQPASISLSVPREHGGRDTHPTLVEYRLNLQVPPTLLIAGAGHIGQAVARLAVDLGFHVVVIDDRAEFAAPARFPPAVELRVGDIGRTLRDWPLDADTYVVIVTRGHRHDRQALDAVIRRPARYIGMIASRRKAQLMLHELAAAGVPAEQVERVRAPIGLPIGAVTVTEIAVSIAAELVTYRRQSRPQLVEGPLDLQGGV